MAPLGGRFARLAQQRRQLRAQRLRPAGLRPGGAGLRPGTMRPFGMRMNPALSFWARQVRRGIQRQLQVVELYGRELKALDSALGQGQPPPRWGGGALLGGRPWGAGLFGGTNVISPYSTLDASTDTGDD